MKCCECGNEYKDVQNARLRVDDKLVGTFYVDNVSYKECTGCKSRLFSPENAEKREHGRRKALEDILQSMPLKSFISVAETIKLLGVTRQAFHKNRRISRGFIYQTKSCGRKVYLIQSVQRYLEKEDGRFTLRLPEEKPVMYEATSRMTAAPYPINYFMRQTRMSDATGTASTGTSVISQQNTEENPYADLKEQ